MKKLKLEHKLADQVLKGEKTSTWRLFDDKDLSVNDTILLIDKVDPKNPQSWKAIGTALIDNVEQKRLGDMAGSGEGGHEGYVSKDAMLAAFRGYYGPNVTWQTPVKVIHFSFSPHIPPIQSLEMIGSDGEVVVYADGGSRGNPGPSASGYAIFDTHKKLLVYRGVYLGVTTNNQAEYTALKLALEEAKGLGAKQVAVYMDSLLVINQMKGIFKVKNRDLWPIHDAVKALCQEFHKVTFTQVPRELNRLADASVNQVLDQQLQQQNAKP